MTDAAVKYRALLISCCALYGSMGPMMAAWYLRMFPKSVSGTYGKALKVQERSAAVYAYAKRRSREIQEGRPC